MENTETSTKKPSRIQRICDAIFFKKNTPYEKLLLAIALTFLTRLIICAYPYYTNNVRWCIVFGCAWFNWCYTFILSQDIIAKLVWLDHDKYEIDYKIISNKWLNGAILSIVSMFYLGTWCFGVCVPYLFLFFPFGYLLISLQGVRKRCPLAIILPWVALIPSIYAMLVTLGSCPFRPVPLFLSAILSPFALMVSVVLVGKLDFHRKIVRVSFAIAVFCIFGRMLMEYHAAKQVTVIPARMEALLEDYRQKHNIPSPSCDESLLNEEPLKSIVSLTKSFRPLMAWKKKYAYRQSDIQQRYQIVSVAGGELREAILALAAIPPRQVTHPTNVFTQDSQSTRLGKVFYDASEYLAVEMKARASQSDIIQEDNAAMASLRDWALNNYSLDLDDKIVGYRIEIMRLKTLARTLAQKRYSESEWLELLGEEPDWRYVAALCCYEDIIYRLPAYSSPIKTIVKLCWGKDVYPAPPMSCYWLSNCGENCVTFIPPVTSFMVQLFNKHISILFQDGMEYAKLSLKESSTCADGEKLYKVSKTLIDSSMSSMPYYQIDDTRTMAMLAWKIMEYSHEHQGVLPENLEQIGESPVAVVNNLPFVYEHGDIEVHANDGDDVTTIRGFRLYVPDEKQTGSPNWKKARSSMMIPLE